MSERGIRAIRGNLHEPVAWNLRSSARKKIRDQMACLDGLSSWIVWNHPIERGTWEIRRHKLWTLSGFKQKFRRLPTGFLRKPMAILFERLDF